MARPLQFPPTILSNQPLPAWSKHHVHCVADVGGEAYLLRRHRVGVFTWDPLITVMEWRDVQVGDKGPPGRWPKVDDAWEALVHWAEMRGQVAVCLSNGLPTPPGQMASVPARDMMTLAPYVQLPAPGPWTVLREIANPRRAIKTKPYSELRDRHNRLLGHVSNNWFDSNATRQCVEAAPRFYRAILWLLEEPSTSAAVKAHLAKVVQDAGLPAVSYKELIWKP